MAPNGLEYPLLRNLHSSFRLNAQSNDSKQQAGFLLHPDIPLTHKPDLCIADVACGTGIVAAELAEKLPEACRIDGFDISDEQFPPASLLPDNLRFHGGMDVFKPPPEHFRNRYDIVFIRYLVGFVTDPTDIVDNLTMMLKPGGYLQWVDMAVGDMTAVAAPGKEAPALARILQIGAFNRRGADGVKYGFDWVQNLDKYFIRSGLEEAKTHIHESREGPFAHYRTQIMLVTNEEVWSKLDVSEEQRRMHGENQARAVEESREGSVMSLPLAVTVGRKPETVRL